MQSQSSFMKRFSVISLVSLLFIPASVAYEKQSLFGGMVIGTALTAGSIAANLPKKVQVGMSSLEGIAQSTLSTNYVFAAISGVTVSTIAYRYRSEISEKAREAYKATKEALSKNAYIGSLAALATASVVYCNRDSIEQVAGAIVSKVTSLPANLDRLVTHISGTKYAHTIDIAQAHPKVALATAGLVGCAALAGLYNLCRTNNVVSSEQNDNN